MKTHKVIDVVYTQEEGNVLFFGTFEECCKFKCDQGFGLEIMPITKEELDAIIEMEKINQ